MDWWKDIEPPQRPGVMVLLALVTVLAWGVALGAMLLTH